MRRQYQIPYSQKCRAERSKVLSDLEEFTELQFIVSLDLDERPFVFVFTECKLYKATLLLKNNSYCFDLETEVAGFYESSTPMTKEMWLYFLASKSIRLDHDLPD